MGRVETCECPPQVPHARHILVELLLGEPKVRNLHPWARVIGQQKVVQQQIVGFQVKMDNIHLM